MLEVLKRDRRTDLDKEVKRLFDQLKGLEPGTDEYNRVANEIKMFYDAKGMDKSKQKVDINVLIKAACYIGGLVLIMKYEEVRVITTKAFSHIARLNI